MSEHAVRLAQLRAGARIETGLPIPPPDGHGRRTGFAGAFRMLRVGQSILCTGSEAANARKQATKLGWRTSQRVMDGGVRVWRVA